MGGLFHNHSDVWLLGFPGYLVAATIMIAEVQAIRTGLSLGWNLGFRSVALYTNFKEAVHAIFEVTSPALPCFALARDICVLLDEGASGSQLGESNRGADFLARVGGHGDEGYVYGSMLLVPVYSFRRYD